MATVAQKNVSWFKQIFYARDDTPSLELDATGEVRVPGCSGELCTHPWTIDVYYTH